MNRPAPHSVRLLPTLLAALVLTGIAYGEETGGPGLWPVQENGSFGYIDRRGKVAIRPQFEEAAAFCEGMAAVRRNRRWGFIDAGGRMVVPPLFEAVEPFSQGMARVKQAGKWGFVDRKGNLVTSPRFAWTMNPREGLALVEESGKYGYIGLDGKLAVPPRFDDSGEFWEGLARVQAGGLWGFIDRTGNMVIEPQFLYAGNFHEGLAQVEVDGRYGYIDKSGRIVIRPAFDSYKLEWFSEGLAAIIVGGKYGFIDNAGRIVIPPLYWLAGHFQEGVARVQTDDAMWVLVNSAGDIVSEGRFHNIRDFHEGLALVRISRNYGFIDPKGRLTVPVEFSAALPFSEGLAAVYVGGSHRRHMMEAKVRPFDPASPEFSYINLPFTREKVPDMSGGKGWGYIDQRGRMVIPPGFDYAGSVVGGLAEASKGNSRGYIDNSGKFVWETREQAPGARRIAEPRPLLFQ